MSFATPSEVYDHLKSITQYDLEDFSGYNTWIDRYCTENSPRPLTRAFKQACALGSAAVNSPSLVSTLNASLRIDAVSTKSAPPYLGIADRSTAATDDCPMAEPLFDRAYRQVMDDEHITNDPHHRLSVYHDDTGTPLLFRKQHDVSTAISLTGLVDERTGLMLPPGTIMSVAAHDSTLAPKTGEMKLSRELYMTRLESYHLDLSTQPLLPLRLSPWAFRDQLNRDIFAIGYNGFYDGSDDTPRFLLDEYRLDVIRKRDIKDFRNVGSEILKLCFRMHSNVHA